MSRHRLCAAAGLKSFSFFISTISESQIVFALAVRPRKIRATNVAGLHAQVDLACLLRNMYLHTSIKSSGDLTVVYVSSLLLKK